MSATYYYHVHTDESRQRAIDYFKVGALYLSKKSNILARFESTDKSVNKGTWSGVTFDDSICMMDVKEWREATEEEIERMLSRHTKEEVELIKNN